MHIYICFFTHLILQMIATVATVIPPLIFGVKLFLTAGMTYTYIYKEGKRERAGG